jgi:sec-independent protein translocase protein TatC
MPDKKMTFTEHLGELRVRIIKALVAVGICFLASFFFRGRIIGFLTRPLGEEANLHYFDIIEPFMTTLKLSLYSGVFFALPVVMYQITMFVLPALKPNESRIMLSSILAGYVLALTGIGLGYGVILPYVFPTLMNFAGGMADSWLGLRLYVDFVCKFFIGFAVAFQFPIIVIALVQFGILTPKMLLKNTKYALLLCMAVGALFTPQDIPTMVFLAAPLFLLYLLSVGVSFIFYRKKKEADQT